MTAAPFLLPADRAREHLFRVRRVCRDLSGRIGLRLPRLSPAGWTSVAAVLALLGLALAFSGAGRTSGAERSQALVASSAVQQQPVPVVAPVAYLALSPDEARALNSAIPFSTAINPPALPFVFAGSADEKERALTCLAAAAYYEAGDDEIGQRAVAQVVINRLRHPAFPKSLCGVVFEGSERPTGCQFTFTCDGALNRPVNAQVWERARAVSEKALAGAIYAPVGNATHYHTDWVLPVWSPEMEKIAAVHTQLFFRWRGWWGEPAAFRRNYTGPEVMDPRIAPLARLLAPAAVDLLATSEIVAPASVAPAIANPALLKGNVVRIADEARGDYLLQLDPSAYPGSYAVVAWQICAGKAPCRVFGWRDAAEVPNAAPPAAAAATSLSFLFQRDPAGHQSISWNCRQIKRDDAAQCLPTTAPAAAAPRSAPTPTVVAAETEMPKKVDLKVF